MEEKLHEQQYRFSDKRKVEQTSTTIESNISFIRDYQNKRVVYTNFQNDSSILTTNKWSDLTQPKKIDRTTLTIINNAQTTLYRLQIIHSNRRTIGHLYRAAFIDRIDGRKGVKADRDKQEKIEQTIKLRIEQKQRIDNNVQVISLWPLLKNQASNDDKDDELAIQFCRAHQKLKNNYVPMVSKQNISFHMSCKCAYQIEIEEQSWAIYAVHGRKRQHLATQYLFQETQSYLRELERQKDQYNQNSTYKLSQKLQQHRDINQFNWIAKYPIDNFNNQAQMELADCSKDNRFSPASSFYEPRVSMRAQFDKYIPKSMKVFKERVMEKLSLSSLPREERRERSKSFSYSISRQQQIQLLKRYSHQKEPEPVHQSEVVLPKQNLLGNCYFMAVILQIIYKADFIINKLWIFQSLNAERACVVLNIDGCMIPVEVDLDALVHKDEEFRHYYCGFSDIHEGIDYKSFEIAYKALIIQKAVAKVYSKYAHLELGMPVETFMMLTNTCSKKYSAKKYKQYIQVMLQWNQQYENDEKLKKKWKRKYAKAKNQHTSLRVTEQKRQDLEDIVMIVVSLGDSLEQLIELFRQKNGKNQKQQAQKLSKQQMEKRKYSLEQSQAVQQKKDQNQKYNNQQGQLQVFAKKFSAHCYSFHGIYHYSEQKKPQNIFIKLRDPRGELAASQWRKRWAKRYNHFSYNAKQRSYGIQIACSKGEFVVSLSDLIELKALIYVCKYHTKYQRQESPFHLYQSFKYKFYRMNFYDSNYKHLKLNLKKKSKFQIALHQINKRKYLAAQQTVQKQQHRFPILRLYEGIKKTNNALISEQQQNEVVIRQVVQKWKYQQVGFSLQVKKGYKLYYFENLNKQLQKEEIQEMSKNYQHPHKNYPITFFQYQLSTGEYSLCVGMRHLNPNFCYLSLSTDSLENSITIDYDKDINYNQTASVQWTKQKKDVRLNWKHNRSLHKFQISQEGQHSLKLDVQLRWSKQETKLKEIDFKKLVQVTFHSAKDWAVLEHLIEKMQFSPIQLNQSGFSKQLLQQYNYKFGQLYNKSILIEKYNGRLPDHMAQVVLNRLYLQENFINQKAVDLTYSILFKFEKHIEIPFIDQLP